MIRLLCGDANVYCVNVRRYSTFCAYDAGVQGRLLYAIQLHDIIGYTFVIILYKTKHTSCHVEWLKLVLHSSFQFPMYHYCRTLMATYAVQNSQQCEFHLPYMHSNECVLHKTKFLKFL